MRPEYGRGLDGGNDGRSGIGRGLGTSGTFGRGGGSGLLMGRYITVSPRVSRLAPGHAARGSPRQFSVSGPSGGSDRCRSCPSPESARSAGG